MQDPARELPEDLDDYAVDPQDPRAVAGVPARAVVAVAAVAVLALVGAVTFLRGTGAPDPVAGPSATADPADPPTASSPTAVAVPGPPLTLEGWGSVRLGGPGDALSRVLCEGSWCPEPVVDVAVDADTGCVQRWRPPAAPGGVGVWVWEVDGRVEAVGVVGPPTAEQRTPLGPAFGALIGDDGSGRPRGGPPGTARVQEVDGVRVTVASLTGQFVEYAEVATPAGAACDVDVPTVDVDPPGPDEPVIVDQAVDGARVTAPVAELPAAGWQDVSSGEPPCRAWLSPAGALAYSRGTTVVGVSARSVAGGPSVGQPIDEVTTTVPYVRLVLDEGGGDGVMPPPWEPTFGTAVLSGTPVGRLSLTTVRAAGAVPGVDWPVRAAAGPTLVSAVVVGESCEEDGGPE